MDSAPRPLLLRWPNIGQSVGFTNLGQYPTPVEPLGSHFPDVYVKRDDLSSPIYGGNKVRTLEVLFDAALRRGCQGIFTTGAHGSNQAVATALHAPRVGLAPGALLFPQPYSTSAADNFRVTQSHSNLVNVPHWSLLPLYIARQKQRDVRRGVRNMIMPPGGATPLGCLGYVSAALELAQQISDKEMPPPDELVVPLGSNCTAAGLLLGLQVHARHSNTKPACIIGVRVTPWPVTSPLRVVQLAHRTARLLYHLTLDPVFSFSKRQLAAGLQVDTTQLGAGYGHPTRDGLAAMQRLAQRGLNLEPVYSGKAAATLLHRLDTQKRCIRLLWATKSSAALPDAP